MSWNEGLCGCFNNCEICVCSFFCPCVQFGKNSEAIDGSDCFLWGVGYLCTVYCGIGMIMGCLKRNQLRQKYAIEGGPCEDFCVHCLCPCCALAQEGRELKSRGAILRQATQQ